MCLVTAKKATDEKFLGGRAGEVPPPGLDRRIGLELTNP